MDEIEGKYFTNTDEKGKAGVLIHEPKFKEFYPVLAKKKGIIHIDLKHSS
jgi:hypothetical protein